MQYKCVATTRIQIFPIPALATTLEATVLAAAAVAMLLPEKFVKKSVWADEKLPLLPNALSWQVCPMYAEHCALVVVSGDVKT